MDLRDALVDWDDPADEGSNTAQIAEHGLTTEEVEFAVVSYSRCTAGNVSHSRSDQT
jgi:hypothetical protein